MPEVVHDSIKPTVMLFLKRLMEVYWGPLYKYATENPALIKTMPGFLLNHEEIIVYVGQKHIAVEYLGPEVVDALKPDGVMNVVIHDHSDSDSNLLEKIIGFEFDSTLSGTMPLPGVSQDLVIPTNRGFDKLMDLGWNFRAQNAVIGFNMPAPEAVEGQFCRIVNGLFFDCTDSGLKTRHIKWLDFFPIHFDGSDPEVDAISFSLDAMGALVPHDANFIYPLPSDYKFSKLPKINRFIEIWGNSESTEPEITSFLAKQENKFILTMRFGAVDAHPELTCSWQSEERPDIRPDFFIVQSHGYADIVEFKLPDLKGSAVVGSTNREAFSAWLNSYIAQTRVYATYFDDPNNRRWFEEKYGFKVHKPKRWLVVGRRSDFPSNIWREIIADYRDVDILTFDDLIDGVVAQFYK